MRANSFRAASFPGTCASRRCNFRHFSCPLEPIQATGVCYRGTVSASKILLDSIFPQRFPERFQMTITAAHIQPIVALIAGVLILIMPRFLNLVVAIYLIFIGLAGLGLFRMFRM
jgi:hypothetical protein